MLTDIHQTNKEDVFTNMVNFARDLGIEVNTNTKARGHQGFFVQNRIDISSKLPIDRKIEVFIHEFTHYIHYKLDKNINKTHGSLEQLFPNADINKIETELLEVTRFIDKNNAYKILSSKKNDLCNNIKNLTSQIKEIYPDFKRSEPYKPIEKVIKKTDAKYLLKYDNVCVKTMFLNKTKNYSISTIDVDFPHFKEEVKLYIQLKSQQRIQKRISSRITRLNNYYKRPSELFARFVEALFVDTNKVTQIAPYTYLAFCKQLTLNKYGKLADFINKFF